MAGRGPMRSHGRMHRVVSRRFDFAESRVLRAINVGACGATMSLVAWLPISFPPRASLATVVVALGARALARARESIVGMVVRSDGSVVALRSDGRAIAGTLAAGSVAFPAFATIVWRAEGERRTRCVAVPADALSREAHRTLRVLLRYATSGVEAEAPASQARASISRALSLFGWPARRWR